MDAESITVSMLFTLDELWLLQSVVRHEVEHLDQWHWPPASLDLNDQIAHAIDFCTTSPPATEAPLLLSKGDCLILDYTVSQSLKDVDGNLLGRNILLKSFAARRQLEEGPQVSAPEVPTPSVADVKERLAAQPVSDDDLEGAP